MDAFNDLVDTTQVGLDEAHHAESNAVLSLPMLKQSLENQQAQGYRVVGQIGSKKDRAQLVTTFTAETADPADAERSRVALRASQPAGKHSCASRVSDHEASVKGF